MIYSYKGHEPKELPNRIRLSNGLTRTGCNYTDEEISDAGFTLAPDKPVMTSDINNIYWSPSEMDWGIVYKTPEQKLYEATKTWKINRQYAVDNIVVYFNGTDIVDELTEEQSASMTDEEIDTYFANIHVIQGDESSQDRMNRALNVLPDEATTVPWLDIDNNVIELNKDALRKILYNASSQQSYLWNLNRPQLEDF